MNAGAQLGVPADLEHDQVPVCGTLHRGGGHRRERGAAVPEPARARPTGSSTLGPPLTMACPRQSTAPMARYADLSYISGYPCLLMYPGSTDLHPLVGDLSETPQMQDH